MQPHLTSTMLGKFDDVSEEIKSTYMGVQMSYATIPEGYDVDHCHTIT